ncbi:MAG: ORF6N domain-containing protein, partial [Bacteroidota bacterium]
RGQKIMLDADLAAIYGVETRKLNQAVKRNAHRFPADFMFQLSKEEWDDLKAHYAMQDVEEEAPEEDTQVITSTLEGEIPKEFLAPGEEPPSEEDEEATPTTAESRSAVNWSRRRYAPYAFTEHGAIMLASVLRSERAVQASIEVVRAFVKMREMLLNQEELARRLMNLEANVEGNFGVLFDAVNELMAEKARPRRRIGFKPDESEE